VNGVPDIGEFDPAPLPPVRAMERETATTCPR